MSHDSSHRDNKPWYRQFWPWFLIMLPASSVVGGITTLVIAVNNADDVVVDEWYREGKAINKSLAAEKQASQLGLKARISHDQGRARVVLEGANVPARSLKLALRHPTLKEQDQVIRLVRASGQTFEAPVGLPGGRWVATLTPEPGDWRIRRRLTLTREQSVTLEPAAW